MQTKSAPAYDALSPNSGHHLDYAQYALDKALDYEQRMIEAQAAVAKGETPKQSVSLITKGLEMFLKRAVDAENIWYKLGGRRHTMTTNTGAIIAL